MRQKSGPSETTDGQIARSLARKEDPDRSFRTSGHCDKIWTSERFRQMLAGAVAWAMGMEDVAL